MKTSRLFFISSVTILLFLFSSSANAQKSGKKIPKSIKTGENFKCDFEPQIDNGIPNYLRVRASRNTDVAVRLIDAKTDKCIRYAFINEGESYDIKNIPEGKYYVKVAFGKEWTFSDTSRCSGGFKQTPLYKKINKSFVFEMKSKHGGTSIPSYELELDMTVSEGKQLKDTMISEKEFNK
jgi:hypothetical protein